MTPGERSLIQRALKTLDRHLHEPGVAFTSTRAAREWLILNMAGLEREEFRVLYLNNQNQLIAGETLFTGTINRTEVHPREVIKRALYHNAAAVVLAHNHPSGEVTPSKADRLITERLVQALGLVDIRVPDHLIVGGNQVSPLPNMVCFNPSQPHHTCFHFYLPSSEASHYENHHRVKPCEFTNNIRHPVFFRSAPVSTAGTVALNRIPVVKCRIFPVCWPCLQNAVRTVLARMSG
ncbi:putative DNA repair protein [Escherichia coli]|nr:putative DNA repair protein [Escherichia coli]